jgi:hypothetical protein
MTFATRQQFDEAVDDWASDEPLGALREGLAALMTDYRLDACAVAEPLAALIYAGDLISPERARACMAAAEADGTLRSYVPDSRAKERLASIRQMLNQMQAPAPRPADTPLSAPPVRQHPPRTQAGYVIGCEVCSTEFRSRRADARLCSPRCRQKASRRARGGSPSGDAA